MVKLSILICTLPERRTMLRELMYFLQSQIADLPEEKQEFVEVLYSQEVSITTGAKRNKLLEASKGEFIVYIDDDDWVSDVYVELILEKIEQNKELDCIGIQGIITTDGEDARQWYISKDYKRWYDDEGVYFRTPNHISPVRREIALAVGFPDKSFGEDSDYSMGILPYLEKEVKIHKNLYHYRYNSKK